MNTRKTLLAVAAVSLALTVAVIAVDSQRGEPADAEGGGAGYVPYIGGRVLDTRGANLTNPRVPGGGIVNVNTGVIGAVAVGVNITLVDTLGPGYAAAWASGPWPGTSIINSDGPGQIIANFAIVPVTPQGTFQLLTQNPAHLLVDVMGYFPGGSTPPAGSGITVNITGYSPLTTITSVIGSATNNTGSTKDIRIDVRCPNGTVEIDYLFDFLAGQTLGWSVLCDGSFTSGASATWIEI
jgi:hypothetical protein